jgi:hypothetical protein
MDLQAGISDEFSGAAGKGEVAELDHAAGT